MIAAIAVILSFFAGAFVLLGYMIWRMMRNDGWDDSNMTNALRLLSHVVLHGEDFGAMWYLLPDGTPGKRPFWYASKDELSEVVKSRPD